MEEIHFAMWFFSMILVGAQESGVGYGKVLSILLDVPQLSMPRASPAIFHLQTGPYPVSGHDSTFQSVTQAT